MSSQWERFDRYYLRYPDLHFSLDISRVDFDENYFEGMNSRVERAFQAMQQLEKGAIANPDEKRMVGHYWLRAPELAPNSQVRGEVEDTNEAIYEFVRTIHSGEVKTQNVLCSPMSSLSVSVDPRSVRNLWRTHSAPKVTGCASIILTIQTRKESIACSKRSEMVWRQR
jgi:hypothetical protein